MTEAISPEKLLGPLNRVEQENAPERLFVAGAVALLKLGTRVSIVGSRKASAAGLKRAAKLARILAEKGITVVSGLAEGIDTAAHEAAMAAGGRTIAVLGTPLDRSYPRKNAGLQQRIVDEHLVVSQFPSGHSILKSNFPRRNRVMALISDATVIMEAGETSGAISQGWEALRLGRRLFIARSVAENPALTWPSEMRKYGAEVLAEAEDVIEALPRDAGGPLAGLSF